MGRESIGSFVDDLKALSCYGDMQNVCENELCNLHLEHYYR